MAYVQKKKNNIVDWEYGCLEPEVERCDRDLQRNWIVRATVAFAPKEQWISG